MTSLYHIVVKAAVLLGLILMGLVPASAPLPLLAPRPALFASDERAGEGLVLLTSYHDGYRWNDDVVEEVTYHYLESGATRDSLMVEYVDALRLSEADGQRLKDRGMPAHGSLILADDPAMAFYLRYRKQLDWPDQVVAMGLNDDRLRLEAKAVRVRILTSYPVMAQSLRLLPEAFGAPVKIIILGDDSDHGGNVIDDLTEVIGTLDEVELVDVLMG